MPIEPTCHALEPPAGFDEVRTSPALSEATQSDFDGQEMLDSGVLPSMSDAAQLDVLLVGLVEVKTCPDASATTQSVADGHAILKGPADATLA